MMFNDTAGNSVVVSMTAIYSTGPVIDITSPVTIVSPATSTSPFYTNQDTVTVWGILVDIAPLSSGNWTYYVNGTEVAHGAFAHVNGLNDFGVDQMYPVALGNNTVVMMFNDTAGNSVVVSLTAIYSTGPIITAPTSTIYTDQGSVYELINGPDMAPLTTGTHHSMSMEYWCIPRT